MDNRLKNYVEKLNKSLDNLRNEFISIRAGRANPKILDKILVDYYGTKTPLPQMGSISVPEARLILIQPFDKSALKEIEKAINMSDIGINPTNDGNVIRLVFPELTEERRKEIGKDIKKKGEDCKVAMRNIRKDAIDFIKKLEKDGETTKDDTKHLTDDFQKEIDKFMDKIDKAVEEKTEEVMKV